MSRYGRTGRLSLEDDSRTDYAVMKLPLLKDGRVDIEGLSAQVDWSQISAFESALLTFQDINWEGISQEVKENPRLARLSWKDHETLLCIAASANQVEVVQLLIECGANVNQTCPQGTPIWGAVWSGTPTIVDLLLNSGANATISISGEHGWSPLHLAARKGYEDIVERLLDANADVNLVDEEGNTPLDQAAMMNQAEVAKLLLGRGANYVKPASKKFVDSLDGSNERN